MYEISASIPGGGMEIDFVGCFYPTVVVALLRQAFTNVEVMPQDVSWNDYDHFVQHSVGEGALRVAERDAQRRGPIWQFHMPMGNGRSIRGHAERYRVLISSEEVIPEPLCSQFLEFLNTLKFAEYVVVESVRYVGNHKLPA
jgi:hypothetical protein